MGALRAKNGHPEPYNVRYWEMDNETFRWFSVKDYAKTVIKYSKAMKAVDPNIRIGLCSYHYYKFFIEELLDICGEHVDFLADRVCEPDNLAKKIAAVRKFNANHKHQIFYTDTEALQNRDPSPAPFVGEFYKKHGITVREARRTWIYALSLVSNLMMDHRFGGDVKFMCFNNLANTTGQSCIETPKEGVALSACGLIYEQMSRTRAAWPLEIDDYSPSSRKEVEIQAAWDKDRGALIVYLLNRCDEDPSVSLDFSALNKLFVKAVLRHMSASGGRVQETAALQGNIKYEYIYFPVSSISPNTFEMPGFSFTEIVIEAEGVV
jgi:alpha-L-arabinofuranosidase